METTPQQNFSLARACSRCIKIKRKCDKKLPQCSRCGNQGRKCTYQNAPSFRTPGISTDLQRLPPDSPTARWRIRTGIYGLQTPDSNKNKVLMMSFAASGLANMRLDPPHVLMEWDPETFEYLLTQSRKAPKDFAQTGGNLFIHPRLYSHGLPPLLQSVLNICKLHTQKPPASQSELHIAITTTTSFLLAASTKIHTFPSTLIFIQSLILLQIMTLFPLTPIPSHLKEAAISRLPLLSNWIHTLYLSAPRFLPSTLSPNQAWILAESVRRTIHFGHKVNALHSMMTRGWFRLTLFVEALPVNRVFWLWDADSDSHATMWRISETGEGREEEGEREVRTELVSYRELTDGWEGGCLGDVGEFEELLLIACKGLEARSAQPHLNARTFSAVE